MARHSDQPRGTYLAEGFWPWRVHADSKSGRVIAEIRWAASIGSVERDRELLTRCVEDVGGRGAGVVFEGDRRFDIVVRMPDAARNDIAAIGAEDAT